MKNPVRAIPFLVCFICTLGGLPCSVSAAPVTSYLIADATTGRVLDSVDPERKLQVGSLTKIATALVVLDWAEATKHDLSEIAVVPPSISEIPTDNPMNLQPGDTLSLKDLLYAALLQSDNLAAQTLADHVGRTLGSTTPEVGNVDLFVAQMNALARKLHMERTQFLNPNGLDSAERKLPYSTAMDLARLTRYAISKPAFRFFILQKDRQVAILHPAGDQTQYLLHNTNELLGVDGVDGVKTGKTTRAGECLIVTAQRAPDSRQEGSSYVVTPRRLIVVILGATDRFTVARQLLARGWALYDHWAAEGRPLKGGELL